MDDLIWRMEDEAGEGPYRRDDIPLAAVRDHRLRCDYINGDNHPTPPEDNFPDGLHPGGFDRFGFCSLQQARGWFDCPADVAIFEEYGYRLAAYPRTDVKPIWPGDHQAIFHANPDPQLRRALLDLSLLHTADDDSLHAQAWATMKVQPLHKPRETAESIGDFALQNLLKEIELA